MPRMPSYGMKKGKTKLIRPRRAKPRVAKMPRPVRPGKALQKMPKRKLPARAPRPVRSARPLKAKGRIVKQQRQRVRKAKQTLRSYRQRAMRSGGRPRRPYEQGQYDPGMQPTSLDDYIRSNQLDNAIWALTRDDPYFDAPYAEDDDLASQAGDYAQMWTEPFLEGARGEREGYYDRFGDFQVASQSRTSGTRYAPTNNPYDRAISELFEGGPGVSQDTFADLLDDRRYRAEGRADRSKDFADFWADMIGDYTGLEFDKTEGRQDFMGDMIREATRDVQHREKLGQSQRQFRAELSADEREAIAKLKQDIRYETKRLKQYGSRNRALNRQGAARIRQAQQRINQSARRLGISAAYLKKAQKESRKTVHVELSKTRGFLVNKFGEPILDKKGRKIKVPKQARRGARTGGSNSSGGGGPSPDSYLPK